MDSAMFSGWGVRTLASSERRYNPIGYHLGTIWPHDNALVAAGLRKYGRDEDAVRIFSGIFQAARHFPHARLPELFAGFARREFDMPAHYPIACHPQAWAAGAVPFLLQTCLGLVPNASSRQLRIVRPRVPAWLEHVELRGLRVGQGSVDVQFTRDNTGTNAEVKKCGSDVRVIADNQASRFPSL
jgi:glycogen debranching enzyme